MHQEKATLQRQLKPMHVWAVAFGCIVGWGSFINPGKKFLPNSGVAGTAIAMALGALVMIIIAFSYAYMVPKYPQAGGEFTFTKMCFGKRAAYVCGWFLVAAYLTNVPMNSTAIGLIVDGLDGSADILKFGFHYQIAGFDVWLGEMLLAMGILILFGLLNIWGVKKAGIVQSILAALLARRMGVKKVIAEVENLNYINLAESMGIDTIVNKKLITASNIFRFTMSSDVQAIKYLTGSEAEVMEFIAKPNSPATRSRIKEMGLPENVIIGGIVRGDKVEIAVGSTEIKAFDRVVVFALPDAVERVCDFFN